MEGFLEPARDGFRDPARELGCECQAGGTLAGGCAACGILFLRSCRS